MWRGGLIDAEGTASTAGAGRDLLASLAARGTFTAKNLDLAPIRRFPSAQGPFELSWGKTGPALKLAALTATADGATWVGSAETGESGDVSLHLTSGDRSVEAVGAIFRGNPFQLVPVRR